VADFTNRLHQLSERGTPVGAEELIERIEAVLAGDPVVVVTKRREGVFMTMTDQPVTAKSPGPRRGLAWALAAFALVLAIGGLYFAFSGSDGQVVDQTTVPTPTTVLTTAPNPTQLPYVAQELDPGVYFIDADNDPSTTTGITYRIEGPGWMGREGPGRDSGVSLHLHPVELRFGPHSPGCERIGGNPRVAGSTAAGLADAFAANGFTIREAPAPVSAFGYDGYHVVVEVPEGCDDAVGGRYDIFAYPGDVMEVWLFDVDGQIVMVEANWKTESTGVIASTEEDMAALRALIDTVMLTP
jgi:hypothetical protein